MPHHHHNNLQAPVLAFCAARPGQPVKPHEIADEISANLDDRHVGVAAVINSCLHLAQIGRINLIAEKPLTFA